MTDDTLSNRRRVPDREICRTRKVGGYLDFTYCLVETPNACEHAVRFGDDVLCRYPDWVSFGRTNPRGEQP
jgi:hypothetical protein